MARRIDTVEARAKLPVRREPYWARLFEGCSLGYRRMSAGGPGAWIARSYDPATGRETRRSIGTFENLPAHERYRAAKAAAEAQCEHLARGGSADEMSVREACDAYIAHLRAEAKHATADEMQARFVRWVHDDKIASIQVQRLAPHHLRTWRQKIIAAPVIVNPHAPADERRIRKRAPASTNRELTALRAALNLARENGAVTTDAAWRVALRPIENADRRRTLYLDRQQRAALIAKAPGDVAAFLRGLALVPLRPGALAALTVAGLDRRLGVVTVGKDKHGRDRNIKLPPATAALFAEHAKDKLPAAPLFARADGKAWDKDAWKKPIKAAAEAAGLPATTTAYTLRHSIITDLIAAGGLDVLTVARLSGTSVPMIEKHYGHLRDDQAAAALATLAL